MKFFRVRFSNKKSRPFGSFSLLLLWNTPETVVWLEYLIKAGQQFPGRRWEERVFKILSKTMTIGYFVGANFSRPPLGVILDFLCRNQYVFDTVRVKSWGVVSLYFRFRIGTTDWLLRQTTRPNRVESYFIWRVHQKSAEDCWDSWLLLETKKCANKTRRSGIRFFCENRCVSNVSVPLFSSTPSVFGTTTQSYVYPSVFSVCNQTQKKCLSPNPTCVFWILWRFEENGKHF